MQGLSTRNLATVLELRWALGVAILFVYILDLVLEPCERPQSRVWRPNKQHGMAAILAMTVSLIFGLRFAMVAVISVLGFGRSAGGWFAVTRMLSSRPPASALLCKEKTKTQSQTQSCLRKHTEHSNAAPTNQTDLAVLLAVCTHAKEGVSNNYILWLFVDTAVLRQPEIPATNLSKLTSKMVRNSAKTFRLENSTRTEVSRSLRDLTGSLLRDDQQNCQKIL